MKQAIDRENRKWSLSKREFGKQCISRTSQGVRSLAGLVQIFSQLSRAPPGFYKGADSLQPRQSEYSCYMERNHHKLLKRAKLDPWRLAMEEGPTGGGVPGSANTTFCFGELSVILRPKYIGQKVLIFKIIFLF